ncbi:MAG: hypothetical protein IKM36_01120 [Oscillospiraceae bacterium]|nr:hypothetical protein [Oscillospiraceae bacterium]MBR3849071.1 hypothetical protein [Oscillospiraceae bacterium]
MRRALAVLLTALLLAGLLTVSCAAAKVVPSKQKLSVDGTTVKCEIYNIDGSNYFKLRDLAALLNGTQSQFSVKWDEKLQTVSLLSSKPYTAVGGELEIGGDQSATAKKSETKLRIDGREVTDLTAYNIGGNNYFKLRELGDYLYFDVSYNAVANTAAITSYLFQGCDKC